MVQPANYLTCLFDTKAYLVTGHQIRVYHIAQTLLIHSSTSLVCPTGSALSAMLLHQFILSNEAQDYPLILAGCLWYNIVCNCYYHLLFQDYDANANDSLLEAVKRISISVIYHQYFPYRRHLQLTLDFYHE